MINQHDRSDITSEQFVEALQIVAAVIGDGIFKLFHGEHAQVRRPVTDSAWMGMQDARRYIGIGETKFRQLIHEKKLPAGKTNNGGKKLLWSKVELDRAMAKIDKPSRSNNVVSHPSFARSQAS